MPSLTALWLLAAHSLSLRALCRVCVQVDAAATVPVPQQPQQPGGGSTACVWVPCAVTATRLRTVLRALRPHADCHTLPALSRPLLAGDYSAVSATGSVELPVGVESLLIQQFLVLLFLASPGKKFLSLRSLALLVQERGDMLLEGHSLSEWVTLLHQVKLRFLGSSPSTKILNHLLETRRLEFVVQEIPSALTMKRLPPHAQDPEQKEASSQMAHLLTSIVPQCPLESPELVGYLALLYEHRNILNFEETCEDKLLEAILFLIQAANAVVGHIKYSDLSLGALRILWLWVVFLLDERVPTTERKQVAVSRCIATTRRILMRYMRSRLFPAALSVQLVASAYSTDTKDHQVSCLALHSYLSHYAAFLRLSSSLMSHVYSAIGYLVDSRLEEDSKWCLKTLQLLLELHDRSDIGRFGDVISRGKGVCVCACFAPRVLAGGDAQLMCFLDAMIPSVC